MLILAQGSFEITRVDTLLEFYLLSTEAKAGCYLVQRILEYLIVLLLSVADSCGLEHEVELLVQVMKLADLGVTLRHLELLGLFKPVLDPITRQIYFAFLLGLSHDFEE